MPGPYNGKDGACRRARARWHLPALTAATPPSHWAVATTRRAPAGDRDP